MESDEFEGTSDPELESEDIDETKSELAEPPANAEDWNDDQWLEWLRRTDADSGEVDEQRPVSASSRIAHSTGGQIVGGAMLGLSHAIYGQTDDDVVIVIPADSNPEDDELLTVNLHPDDPSQSTVVVHDTTERDQSAS